MKFNKNEFGWKEKVSVNTDELVTKNDIPHYNETLITEISGEDFGYFMNNDYFNMNALNIDETKSYIVKNKFDINDDEEYTFKFVYDKEADVLINEYNQLHIYNHKSYNGTNLIEDVNSAVLTNNNNITPMVLTPEVEGYIRLYEIEKVELDTNCLPDNVSIPNSLTVGTRIGDIGEFSVAEGEETTGSGYASHVEGYGTTSSALASHAEGNYTTASGNSSHSEGNGTTASGVSSHTEGMSTTASGGVSHAEGRGSTASGMCSHAEGDNATVLGDSSHIEGKSSKSASSVIQNLSSSTTNDTIMTNWETSKFSLAKGNASHVEGKDNLALGNYSHAEGNTTMASGNYSHAEGGSTKASGEYSHAEGMETKAIGHKSHAEGYYSTALGECSHAEGFSNSTANKQITNLSTTTSNTTIINAWKRVKFSLAKSNYSHVEGDSCLALDECSHAEGNRTIASNSYCHSEGDSTKATGNTSHAEGYKTEAMGDYSHVEGYSTIASGENSHAEGYYTKASGQQQHVQGKYNIVDTSYAHIVGNGSSETSRSNAHTLDWNGNAWYAGKLTQEGTPTEDKDLTTKKYVDDNKFSRNYEDLNNEPFTFVPIKLTETNESNGAITAYCDVFDLEQGYRYVADFTKYNYACLYTFNNDNTKNTLVATTAYLSTGRNGMITVLSSSATKRDILWMSAYGSEQIRIIKNSDETFTITNTLIVPRVTNTREFTPTSDYHLVHKKYVDDAIANQPQISFDTEGNLVVTIGGVTKKFKEITE